MLSVSLCPKVITLSGFYCIFCLINPIITYFSQKFQETISAFFLKDFQIDPKSSGWSNNKVVPNPNSNSEEGK
jgi:hypothetical protein